MPTHMSHNRISVPKTTTERVSSIMRNAEATRLESTKSTCQHPDCKQVGFLLTECNKCKMSFCSSHFQYENHQCKEYQDYQKTIPTCPLCNQIVRIPPNSPQTTDYFVNKHINAGCPSERDTILPVAQKNSPTVRSSTSNKVLYPCHHEKCPELMMMADKCEQCNLTYCVSHKWPDIHHCTGLPDPKSTPKSESVTIVSSIFQRLGLVASSSAPPITSKSTSKGRKIGAAQNNKNSQKSNKFSKFSKSRNQNTKSGVGKVKKPSASASTPVKPSKKSNRPPPRYRE